MIDESSGRLSEGCSGSAALEPPTQTWRCLDALRASCHVTRAEDSTSVCWTLPPHTATWALPTARTVRSVAYVLVAVWLRQIHKMLEPMPDIDEILPGVEPMFIMLHSGWYVT